MELTLLVYAISLLPVISEVAAITCIGILVATFLGFVFIGDEITSAYARKQASFADLSVIARIYLRLVLWLFIPLLMLCVALKVFLPSEKTAYMMVGAYAAQKVAENPQTQQISGKILTIINAKIDTYASDAVDEAKARLEKAAKAAVK